jgi:hypothetical protein
MKKYLTLDEIVADVVKNMTTEDYQYLTTVSRTDMIQYHTSVGLHVRNFYKLWEEKHPLTKPWFDDMKAGRKSYIEDGVDLHPCHPDAVSAEVLKLIWDDVNDW